jgi:RND family efflux transporter MFP subunit
MTVWGCKSKSDHSDKDGHNEGKSDTHAESAESKEGHGHDDHSHSVTVWQDSIELFAEWSDLVSGETVSALVHLTDMRDFSAVATGSVSASWEQGGRVVRTESPVSPVQPGIFRMNLQPTSAGVFQLNFHVRSTTLDAHIVVKDMQVFASDAAVMHDDGEEDREDLVSFLKEQQWQIPFATEVASRRTLHESIRALGEIKAAGIAEAEVFAPFAGVLMPDPEHGIVRPGQRVSKGDILARLAPVGETESGWNKLVNDYRLAKTEFERAEQLAKQGAVSEKRVQEAKADLENKETRVRGALGESADLSTLELDGQHFHLRAPRSGVLADVHLRFGQHVEAGEHLVNIVDPSRIWLEAQVPASESFAIEEVKDAYFSLTGSDSILRLKDFDGRLLSISTLLDPLTRRIPVIFELSNKNNRLRPGSFAQVSLKSATAHDALAITESALLDEDGVPICYVQVEGESFEKRVLRVGVKDEGYVEILSGLSEGERVVTRGAFKVKLAATKTGGADAHAGHGH